MIAPSNIAKNAHIAGVGGHDEGIRRGDGRLILKIMRKCKVLSLPLDEKHIAFYDKVLDALMASDKERHNETAIAMIQWGLEFNLKKARILAEAMVPKDEKSVQVNVGVVLNIPAPKTRGDA